MPGNVPSPLEPTRDEIMRMGEAALRVAADYFDTVRDMPISPAPVSPALSEPLGPSAPVEGVPFDELLHRVESTVIPASRHSGHPRFFGYVNSPGTPATALADLLASALDQNLTSWRSAPGPTEMERQTVGWIREILGLAPGADGLFVSGGSMANLCGLTAARDARAGIGVAAAGCQALDSALRIYASEEVHHSIQKAAGLLGIGRGNVRLVPTDARFRMRTDLLEEAIREDGASGYRPICVVATAGTVNTGAVDDIEAIADVAETHGLWLHVDASYGGFAALSPTHKPLFRGIERADSVALDPHKWLYVPLDCGCIVYRNPAAARLPFAHDAEYTRVIGHTDDQSFAFWDFGPELSRRFRALKVWMALAHAGTRTLGEVIASNCDCARYLAELVEEADDFEMLAPVELSIFCFRYVPPEYRGIEDEGRAEELDRLNESILADVQREGSSYLSNARINGRFALRGCVLNYRTTRNDMRLLLDDIRAAAAVVQGRTART